MPTYCAKAVLFVQIWLAVTGLLIHIVLPRNVETINRLIRIPEKPLAKLRSVILSKDVIVRHGTPNSESTLTSSSMFDIGNVGIWDEVFHHRAKYVSLMRGCCGSVLG